MGARVHVAYAAIMVLFSNFRPTSAVLHDACYAYLQRWAAYAAVYFCGARFSPMNIACYAFGQWASSVVCKTIVAEVVVLIGAKISEVFSSSIFTSVYSSVAPVVKFLAPLLFMFRLYFAGRLFVLSFVWILMKTVWAYFFHVPGPTSDLQRVCVSMEGSVAENFYHEMQDSITVLMDRLNLPSNGHHSSSSVVVLGST